MRGLDLNQRPRGYEPRELPDCSTPRYVADTSVVTKDQVYNPVRSLWPGDKPWINSASTYLYGRNCRESRALLKLWNIRNAERSRHLALRGLRLAVGHRCGNAIGFCLALGEPVGRLEIAVGSGWVIWRVFVGWGGLVR